MHPGPGAHRVINKDDEEKMFLVLFFKENNVLSLFFLEDVLYLLWHKMQKLAESC